MNATQGSRYFVIAFRLTPGLAFVPAAARQLRLIKKNTLLVTLFLFPMSDVLIFLSGN